MTRRADVTAVGRAPGGGARDLGRLVVVEGVETQRDAEWLRERGCHYAQGFYFSVPLTSEEVLKFIAQHYRNGAPAASGASGMS